MRDDLTGLVLAGGAGRRIGRDKAAIEVDGQSLLARVAGRLATRCPTVLVAGGDRALPAGPWRPIDDRPGGGGPLAGLLGALAVAETPLVAVVAVDMPHADPAVLAALADAWQGEAAVVPVAAGRPQPLHAVYATAGLPRLASLFDAGARSVTDVVRRTTAAWVPVVGPARWAENINTPDDLRRLRDGR